MLPITLRTERLELSTPVEGDVDAICAACQDDLIQHFTTVPSPYRREHAEGFVRLTAQWWEKRSECTWAIRSDGTLAGVISLRITGRSDAEIGYWMAPASRGRGYLTEAARAVIEWGFSPDGLALARIEWRAVVGNTVSARAARTLGFRHRGTLRSALVSGTGERHDGWIADLLADDDRTPQHWPVLEN